MALMKTSIFALLGLAALSVGLVLNFVMPGIRYYAWIILALGAALLAVAFIFDFRRVQNTLVSHQGKFGVGTTVGISLFFGVILLTNAISDNSPSGLHIHNAIFVHTGADSTFYFGTIHIPQE